MVAPDADNIALDTHRVEVLALAPSSKATAQGFSIQSLTTNNVLVMLVKFTDSAAADAFTPAQVQQVMVTNPGSVANYYSEVSFGQQALNVTVACLTPSAGCTASTYSGGWLTALDPTKKTPIATPRDTNGNLVCDYSAIHLAADTAATKAGINVASYTNRYYVFPYLSVCGWAGLAYVGYGEAYSNGYNQLSVYGHELGHNFGLLHAGRLTCTGLSMCATGSVSEYGDSFDVMGNISTMHFNAMQKSLLQWIPATSVKTHTSGTATYTLSPIESGGAASYAIKIPAAANRTYWVEYRQPIGFDGPGLGGLAFPSNGAQIRLSSPFTSVSGSDDTQLLDMTPGTGSFTDAALLAGQSYTDSTYGITVTVGTASPTALNVTVAMGAGAPTTTTLASSVNPSALGAGVTFTATVTGTAPTGTVNFTDSGSSLAGCGAVALSGSGNVRTAQCSTSTLSGGTHSVAAAYGGDAANNASGSTAVSQVVNKATSTTGVVSSKNPSTFGTSVTFTATVAGSAPTGSVDFKDGGASIAGCSAVALAGSGNSRTAACTTGTLSVSTHTIVASYAGDAGNLASSSPSLSQVVNSAGLSPTTASLAGSLNPSTAGTSVTFTATVTGSNPTGSVNFKDGAASITGCGAVALAGSGNSRTAACSTSALTAATHGITAAYAGDAANAASTSAALSQVVNAGGGSINVALASNGGVATASSTYSSGFPVSAIINNMTHRRELGRQRRLERQHAEYLSRLGADQLQRQQDDRPRGRLHGAGQLRQSDRADRHDDVHALRHHRLHRAGLERQQLGDTGQRQRQQPGQAHGQLLRLHHRPDPHQHHRRARPATPASPKSRPGAMRRWDRQCRRRPSRARSTRRLRDQRHLYRHGDRQQSDRQRQLQGRRRIDHRL